MNDDYSKWPTGRLLSMAARLMEHEWEQVLREFDMSSAGLVVMHTVVAGPAAQREIARVARVTEQTAGNTIERLERSGYVTRGVDPNDHRRRLVTATEEGIAVYEQLVEREQTDPRLISSIGGSDKELRSILLELIRAQNN